VQLKPGLPIAVGRRGGFQTQALSTQPRAVLRSGFGGSGEGGAASLGAFASRSILNGLATSRKSGETACAADVFLDCSNSVMKTFRGATGGQGPTVGSAFTPWLDATSPLAAGASRSPAAKTIATGRLSVSAQSYFAPVSDSDWGPRASAPGLS
jgi:hypothetical protein